MNNLTNKRFGEWSVMSFVGRNKYRQPIWKCRCSCGTVREIPESNLTRKASTNCGCLKSKNQRKRAYKHGKVNTPLYRSWANMLQRCNNPKNPRFKDYGGRGVAVCEEWKDFTNFAKWANQNGYIEGLTIERVDVDGDYSPENCKWVPLREQSLNKRTTLYVTFNNEKKSLKEWAERFNISYGSLKKRLYQGGEAKVQEKLFTEYMQEYTRSYSGGKER